MRVALLVSGEFREFAIAHKFWPFLHWNDIDIYFSLWSTSSIVYTLDRTDVEPIDIQLINSFKPKACCIEDPRPDIDHNALKMIHRLKEGFRLILSTGINYDVIMTIRPDLAIVYSEEDFRKELDRAYRDQICLIDGFDRCKLKSGDSIIMFPLKYVHRFLRYDFEKPLRITNNIHNVFGDFFNGRGDVIHDMTQRHIIVRPNARELTTDYQKSFKSISHKSEEWWKNYHNEPFCLPRVIYDKDCT